MNNQSENFEKSRWIFISSTGYVARRLVEASSSVGLTLVETSSKGLDNKTLIDLENFVPAQTAFIQPGDTAFILSAISSPELCEDVHSNAWRINLDGTIAAIHSIVEAGARVIFFSTDMVYGDTSDNVNENTALDPVGRYASMKSEVERSFLGCSHFKALRLSYVFSQSDSFYKYLIRCSEDGAVADVYRGFERSMVSLDDVVSAAIALALHWGSFPQQSFNIVGPDVVSRFEYAMNFKKYISDRLQVREVDPPDGFFQIRPRRISASSLYLAKLLGREPQSVNDFFSGLSHSELK